MDLGFETIGNATLICHDRGPVLATDPWIVGGAYFGSWALSHVVPDEQIDAIKGCKHLWISHGHPDHLSPESLALLKDKIILLPDHVGGRIANDLKSLGYKVQILPDGKWTNLTPRLHVLSIANYNQDGILLVDIGGTLLVNLNDGSPLGWDSFVKEIIRKYKQTFLLKLFGYGDADMINYIKENGSRIEPTAAKRFPVGKQIQQFAEGCGIKNVIPFSSMHIYQRADSAWANQFITPISEIRQGFDSSQCTLLPAFIRYDCNKELVSEIGPEESPSNLLDPKIFDDDWAEPLEKEDVQKLNNYFRSIETLRPVVDFISFRVGGQDHMIELATRGFKTGVRFEVPRNSLMQVICYECFDDLLIGNFMRTCLIGNWSKYKLYPDFTPYVAKYADNGRAKTDQELKLYFLEYQERAPSGFWKHRLEQRFFNCVRRNISPDSKMLNFTRDALKRALGRF